MTEENEKYAALITVFAILVTVIYANGRFDLWDFFVGSIGLIFGLQFIKEIDEKDKFLCLLVGSLISISIVTIICVMCDLFITPPQLEKPPHLERPPKLEVPFIMFLSFTIVSTIVLYLISKQKKK